MSINEIKQEINKLIRSENLVYCDVCYDGVCENNKDIWFYDLNVYDTRKKINKFVSKLNKYAETNVFKNLDDGDYTIECTIKRR